MYIFIVNIFLDFYQNTFLHRVMFGIVSFGSRQYKIVPSEGCVFDKIEGKEGDEVLLKGLVLLSNNNEDVITNNSILNNYTIKGTIIKQFRDDKVIAYKKKRRQGYERKRGHRQYKTLVLINSIDLTEN